MSPDMPDSHIPVKHFMRQYSYPALACAAGLGQTGAMKNLYEIRKRRKMTQVDLAAVVGCNQATISKLEKCQANATISLANRLAKALDVEAVELFGMDGLEQQLLDAIRRAPRARVQALMQLLEGADE